MAEVRITIQIEDENNNLVDGIINIINKDDLTIVNRSATIDGKAVFVVEDTSSYIVTTLTDNFYGKNSVIDTPIHNAVYAASVTQKSLPTPTNDRLCLVTGKALDSLGKVSKNFFIQLSIIEGLIIENDNPIFNNISYIRPDADGHIQFELYKNKKYRLTLNSNHRSGEFEVFEINVPDKDHTSLTNILFPKITSLVFGRPIDSSGDYDISLNLSDGTVTQEYLIIEKLLSLVASNVDVELQKKDDDTTNLRVGATGAGSTIEFYSNLPGFVSTSVGWEQPEYGTHRTFIQRIEF